MRMPSSTAAHVRVPVLQWRSVGPSALLRASMNPDLEKLISLQEADQAIAHLRAEIASLPSRVAVIEGQLRR